MLVSIESTIVLLCFLGLLTSVASYLQSKSIEKLKKQVEEKTGDDKLLLELFLTGYITREVFLANLTAQYKELKVLSSPIQTGDTLGIEELIQSGKDIQDYFRTFQQAGEALADRLDDFDTKIEDIQSKVSFLTQEVEEESKSLSGYLE